MKENSIEEDINYLDSMVKEYKQFGNLYNEDYEDEDRIYQALEHILSNYKRVQKELEELKEYYEEQNEVNAKFIPVQKVKDKMEELDKLLEKDLQDEIKINTNRFIIIQQCKVCLQELLEGRK